jgi:hypothetical protein
MTETLDKILLQMLRDSGALLPNADPVATAQAFAMAAGELPLRYRDFKMLLGCATAALLKARYEHGIAREIAREQAETWGNRVYRLIDTEADSYIAAQLQKGQPQ